MTRLVLVLALASCATPTATSQTTQAATSEGVPPPGNEELAKAWGDGNRFGLSARVGFALGKTEIDRKLKRVAKVTEKAAGETISIGGGTEDWGAGRLIRVELLGVRVATDREKKMLFEKTK